MSVPTQARDEIRITGAMPADRGASLILQTVHTFNDGGGHRGYSRIFSWDTPLSWDEYQQRYPLGSPAREELDSALGCMETLGTFAKNGLIDRALVLDLFWVNGLWDRARGVCLGQREDYGEPRLFENFELLASS